MSWLGLVSYLVTTNLLHRYRYLALHKLLELRRALAALVARNPELKQRQLTETELQEIAPDGEESKETKANDDSRTGSSTSSKEN